MKPLLSIFLFSCRKNDPAKEKFTEVLQHYQSVSPEKLEAAKIFNESMDSITRYSKFNLPKERDIDCTISAVKDASRQEIVVMGCFF
jgi:hypothetical protein